MILSIGFLGIALGAGDVFNLSDPFQVRMCVYASVFTITYFLLRAVRKASTSAYSRTLHWVAFGLLLISCFGLTEILARIGMSAYISLNLIAVALFIGIANGLFLCCVFLSRYPV